MKRVLSILVLLFSMVEHSLSQDSAVASINNTNPMVGDTVLMRCTLVRQNLFITDSVNYIVNSDFNIFSSVINRNSGSVGGIEVSRMQASTPVSDDRITLEGAILLSNIQETDATNGTLKLGCVGKFGSNPGDNINVTVSVVIMSNGSSSILMPSTIGISCYLLLFLIAPLRLL